MQLIVHSQTIAQSFQSVQEKFSQIDQHAKDAPAKLSEDIDALAAYLLKGSNSEEEKARSAFSWIAFHIRYDYGAASPAAASDALALETLKKGKAVCEGYAALFQTLGRKMGLEVIVIPGFSKGFGFKPGQKISRADHAWNAVRINGKWELMDATWGAGYVEYQSTKVVFVEKFTPFWFMTEPEAFVFSHYPEDNQFLYFSPGITFNQFNSFNKPEPGYFCMGFSGKETIQHALTEPGFLFPMAYDEGFQIAKFQAPASGNLKAGKVYAFEFQSPLIGSFWALNNDEFLPFNKSENGFSISSKPKKGELQIAFQREGEEIMTTFILYKVAP